jgi:hypothetical protein
MSRASMIASSKRRKERFCHSVEAQDCPFAQNAISLIARSVLPKHSGGIVSECTGPSL